MVEKTIKAIKFTSINNLRQENELLKRDYKSMKKNLDEFFKRRDLMADVD